MLNTLINKPMQLLLECRLATIIIASIFYCEFFKQPPQPQQQQQPPNPQQPQQQQQQQQPQQAGDPCEDLQVQKSKGLLY